MTRGRFFAKKNATVFVAVKTYLSHRGFYGILRLQACGDFASERIGTRYREPWQTAQNTHDIADVSGNVKVLSGEVHDIRSDLSKMNIDLQKVMENFIDPLTFKQFLILNGQKLEADVAYTHIYGMAKKIGGRYW